MRVSRHSRWEILPFKWVTCMRKFTHNIPKVLFIQNILVTLLNFIFIDRFYLFYGIFFGKYYIIRIVFPIPCIYVSGVVLSFYSSSLYFPDTTKHFCCIVLFSFTEHFRVSFRGWIYIFYFYHHNHFFLYPYTLSLWGCDAELFMYLTLIVDGKSVFSSQILLQHEVSYQFWIFLPWNKKDLKKIPNTSKEISWDFDLWCLKGICARNVTENWMWHTFLMNSLSGIICGWIIQERYEDKRDNGLKSVD